jgi:hypothetical protein
MMKPTSRQSTPSTTSEVDHLDPVVDLRSSKRRLTVDPEVAEAWLVEAIKPPLLAKYPDPYDFDKHFNSHVALVQNTLELTALGSNHAYHLQLVLMELLAVLGVEPPAFVTNVIFPKKPKDAITNLGATAPAMDKESQYPPVTNETSDIATSTGLTTNQQLKALADDFLALQRSAEDVSNIKAGTALEDEIAITGLFELSRRAEILAKEIGVRAISEDRISRNRLANILGLSRMTPGRWYREAIEQKQTATTEPHKRAT